MKKRVNINKDVESRRNIAAIRSAVKPIVKPTKTEKADATSKKIQGGQSDQGSTEVEAPKKRGRATQGDTQEV